MANKDILVANKIQNGDIRAFENLFREYYPVLVNYAIRYLTDTAKSEEIVQEMFFNIWRKKEKFIIKTSLKSYLYRSVRNNCLQYIEHLNVERKYEKFVKNKPSKYYETPENELDLKEIYGIIEQTLEKLPERCSTIFKMSRFEGLKYHEIADKLSISIKTVEANMSKALKLFRKNLKFYIKLVLMLIYLTFI